MKALKRMIAIVFIFGIIMYFNSTKTTAISPGIDILREETKLIKCCVNGQKISFSEDEFVSLTGSDFEYITLCSLPPLKDGVLKFAGVDALKGQHISPSGLSLLKFVPSSSFNGSSGFCFTVASKGWETHEIDCLIRFSETVNYSPIAAASGFETYKNVSVTSKLNVYDPDGDKLTFVIERYPKSGTLLINDGVATYTPLENFSGADSFVYHAVDSFGNKSDSATADITVRKSKSGIYFIDMKEDSAHLAAIKLAENEVMTYTLIGDSYYFTPDQKVSRIDYTVMLVSAAGIEVPNKEHPTNIFVDTESQSIEKRLYLEAAVTSGIIKVDGNNFYPDDIISVKDAIAMAENALADSAESISFAYFEDTSKVMTKKDAAMVLSAFIE